MPEPAPELRAVLVGCGMISLYHLRAWANAGVPVVAVCDIDRASARAAEFGVPGVHAAADAAALFAEAEFDLVDVAASVEAHDPATAGIEVR